MTPLSTESLLKTTTGPLVVEGASSAMTTKVTLTKTQLGRLAAIERRVAPLRKELREHKIYQAFEDLDDVRSFTQIHVFAIWDFMSLLKSLQAELSEQLPWIPTAQARAGQLVNEMVSRYERDVNERGETMSHFEMYLGAMTQLGADTKCLETFLSMLQGCVDLKSFSTSAASATKDQPPQPSFAECVDSSLLSCGAPRGAADFAAYTFSLVDAGERHETAASLAFGRQYVILDRLLSILSQAERAGDSVDKFKYMVVRHKDLYAKNYTPLSFQLLVELCGTDEKMWREAGDAAERALQARIKLWDATHDYLLFKKPIMEHECLRSSGCRRGSKWQRVMSALNLQAQECLKMETRADTASAVTIATDSTVTDGSVTADTAEEDSEASTAAKRQADLRRVMKEISFQTHIKHMAPASHKAKNKQQQHQQEKRRNQAKECLSCKSLLRTTLPDVPEVAFKSIKRALSIGARERTDQANQKRQQHHQEIFASADFRRAVQSMQLPLI